MNDDFHNISIDFGKFVYIYLRKFLLVTKRVRGRFVAFSMSVPVNKNYFTSKPLNKNYTIDSDLYAGLICQMMTYSQD